MSVGTPAAHGQVDFHIAGTGCGITDLNDRIAKIRPAFNAHKTGMQNADGPAISGVELVTAQALVAPDGLQQTFRRRTVFIAQDAGCRQAGTPSGVKIIDQRRHCGLLLRRSLSKVKPARIILIASNGGFVG